MPRVQYPGLTAPVQVDTTPPPEAPSMDWLRPRPDFAHKAKPTPPSSAVAPLEPSLIVSQALGWIVQHPGSYPRSPLRTDGKGQFEPLEPSLRVPQALAWIRQHPATYPRRPHPPSSAVAPLEPSLIVSQNLGWIVQHPASYPRPPLRQSPWFTVPLEPSLTTAQALAWIFPQQPQPQYRRAPAWTLYIANVSPLPNQALSTFEWFQTHPTSQTPRKPLNPQPAAVRPLEPSLVVAQNLAWIRQHPTPQPKPIPLGPQPAGVKPLEPSLIVSQNLAWLRQQPLPPLPRPTTQQGTLVEPFAATFITFTPTGPPVIMHGQISGNLEFVGEVLSELQMVALAGELAEDSVMEGHAAQRIGYTGAVSNVIVFKGRA